MGSNREKSNIAIAILDKWRIWIYPISPLSNFYLGLNNLYIENKIREHLKFSKFGAFFQPYIPSNKAWKFKVLFLEG